MTKKNKPDYNGRTKPSIKTAAPLMKEAKQTIDSLIMEKKQLIKFVKQIREEIVEISNINLKTLVKFEMMILVGKINSKLKLFK